MTTTTTPELDLITRELAQPEGTVRNPRRNGKIARLPAATRDIINHMLDDGLPYQVILDELGEPGHGLNAQNLTNWVHGGYQDYLAHQAALDRARAQIEIGLELVEDFTEVDIATVRRACSYVAAVQLLQALREQGDDTLKKLLENRPAKYLTAINTLCRQSNAHVKVEKLQLTQQLRSATGIHNSSLIKPNQGPTGDPITVNRSSSVSSGSNSSDQASISVRLAQISVPVNRYGLAKLPSSPIKPIQASAKILAHCNDQRLALHDTAAACPANNEK